MTNTPDGYLIQQLSNTQYVANNATGSDITEGDQILVISAEFYWTIQVINATGNATNATMPTGNAIMAT